MSQINGGVIPFVRTKSSKARGVPVSRQLEKELREHHRRHGEGERVFGPAMSAFRDGVRRAGVTLPKGQLRHVLRYTFASYFMMNGGNILSLQRALGHHSLAMTMRYAHLSPEHLAETRHRNPLAQSDGAGRQKTKRRRGGRQASDRKHSTRIATLPVLCLPANGRRKDTVVSAVALGCSGCAHGAHNDQRRARSAFGGEGGRCHTVFRFVNDTVCSPSFRGKANL